MAKAFVLRDHVSGHLGQEGRVKGVRGHVCQASHDAGLDVQWVLEHVPVQCGEQELGGVGGGQVRGAVWGRGGAVGAGGEGEGRGGETRRGSMRCVVMQGREYVLERGGGGGGAGQGIYWWPGCGSEQGLRPL